MRVKATSLSLLSLVGFTLPLFAQTTPTPTAEQLPTSINPSLTARLLATPLAPTNNASVTTPGFTPQAATPAMLNTTFVLNQLQVVGGSVYGNAQLENMFRDYIGRTVSLADLQKIADDITLKYRHDGYILTRAIVPAQNVRGGIATIRVIEGYVNQVNIEGDPKGARALLENYGDQIKKARPFNIKTLERFALLANDIPGMTVRAVLGPARIQQDELAPSEITPGAATLTFVAAQSTAHGYLTFDNRGTKFLGPNEFLFGGNLNSILRAGDTTGVQALTTTNTKELRFIRLYHQTPIGDDGLILNVAASYSRTEPQYTLSSLNLEGKSTSLSAGVTYPIIRSQAQSLYVNAGLDATNTKTDILTGTPSASTLYNDKLRSLRVGANYDNTDTWLGMNQLGLQLSQGIPALGATKNGSSDLSRTNGKTDYTKVNANAARLQGLGHNFSLYAAAQGQYTSVPLLSAEQFTFGGAQFGQAYDPAEISGDRGIEGKVEVRYDAISNWKTLQAIQPFAFYDVGKVWNVDPVGMPYANASAASAGFGVRANVTNFLSGSLTWAKPLTHKVATYGEQHSRLFFSVTLAGDTPSNTSAIPLPPAPVQPVPSGTGLTPIVAAPTPAPQPQYKTSAKHVSNLTTQTTETTAPAKQLQFVGLTEVDNNTAKQSHVGRTKAKGRTHQVASQDATTSGDHYALQLMSGRDASSLKHFAAQHHLTAKTHIIKTQRNGSDWYVLAYGSYGSAEQAAAARAELPATLKQLKPWVRKI